MAQSKAASSTASPQSIALFTEEQNYLAPGSQPIVLLSQLALSHGTGATLTDVDGHDYIDFHAGVTAASLGHAPPRLCDALEAQLRQLIVGNFTTANRQQLLELIASLTPGELNKTQLYSGGSEAVDAALRLAQAHTQQHELISFWGGFHGKTGRAASLLATRPNQARSQQVPAPIWCHTQIVTAAPLNYSTLPAALPAWILLGRRFVIRQQKGFQPL